MNISVLLPSKRSTSLRWVAEIVFGQMLGLQYRIDEGTDADVVISCDGRKLILASLFPNLRGDLPSSSLKAQMPVLPLDRLDVAKILPEAASMEPLPLLYHESEITVAVDEIRCGVDILGSIFFMLSRFEEIALPDRDGHDRFPATASVAWAEGFLYRPLVDEYVEFLWLLMNRLWPSLERTRREGKIKVSCDVDHPFDPAIGRPKALMRSMLGDMTKRGNPSLALRRARNFFAHHKSDYTFDPNYTFDWYMNVCERSNCKAAFYMIADHSAGDRDGFYSIDEPRILNLMRLIDSRGHEIGQHGSYNTFRDPRQIVKERQKLMSASKRAGLIGTPTGNRQHYLRWDAAQTPDHLDSSGFEYDTTGSFADRPGFRYGTSHPFPMWSWKQLAPLKLRQAPLVVMECSVIADQYLNLGHSNEAIALMFDLKYKSMRYGGDFTLLWHNSYFTTPEDREFFTSLLM